MASRRASTSAAQLARSTAQIPSCIRVFKSRPARCVNIARLEVESSNFLSQSFGEGQLGRSRCDQDMSLRTIGQIRPNVKASR